MSGVQVKVTNAQPVDKEGSFKDENGGTVEYKTRKQEGVMIAGEFRYPYDVRLEADQKPYPEGMYELDLPAMIQVNKGAHSLGKFTKLRPIAPAAK